MRSYTVYDLGMNVHCSKYLLPFSVDVTDDDIIQKAMTLFQTADIYERKIFKDYHPDKQDIVYKHYDRTNTSKIEMKCVYTGKSEQYLFSIVMEVFRYKSSRDDTITHEDGSRLENGQCMIAVQIEQEEGDLLEELIELNVMPTFKEKTGLKKYKYNFV